ncbi:MAG: response regulator [Candidatus Aureabacteria bacterium]|nr:response regulator [Candidatus Auribacterota bacterium]
MKKVLLVEDDQYFRDMLLPLLQQKGYLVDAAEDGVLALKKLQNESYHVIILDRNLPEVRGEEILNLIKMQKHSPKVIIITGEGEAETRKEMLFQGADAYLEKPFEVKKLIKLIEKD